MLQYLKANHNITILVVRVTNNNAAVLTSERMIRCDRLAFYREVEVMLGLRDPHIVQVLGVCSRADPVAVVVEYSELGDLHQFLQTSAPDQLSSVLGSSFRTLRFASVI